MVLATCDASEEYLASLRRMMPFRIADKEEHHIHFWLSQLLLFSILLFVFLSVRSDLCNVR
jgi:hypothetical protein